MSEFLPLKVADIHAETNSMMLLTLQPESSCINDFAFEPGQFLMFEETIEGQSVQRAYSICNAKNQSGQLQIGVKAIPGGIFSGWVKQSLKIGATLHAKRPDGRFFGTPIDLSQGEYVGIAVGSGITPVLSVIRSALVRGGDSRFTLYYGNRDVPSIAFKHALQTLKNQFMDRFNLVHVLSRGQAVADLMSGRLDSDRLSKLLGHFNPTAIDRAFICGPDDMMSMAREVILARGVDANEIRIESFGEFASETSPVSDEHVADVDVRFTLNGRSASFQMSHEQLLLDGGHAAGVAIPFACQGGVCATCRCRLVNGTVEMNKNYALTDDEVEAGYILACQSRIKSDQLEITFDA